MTRQTDFGLLLGGNGFVVETEDSARAAATAGLGVLESIGMAGLAVRPPQIAFLPMF